MTRYVIDSWAWVEYIIASKLGENIRPYIENADNELFTMSISVTELISKSIRENRDPNETFAAVSNLSKIQPIDADLSRSAGEIHAHMKRIMNDFGIADAFILAFARKNNMKVITGDPHFKREKETIFIE